MVEHVSIVCIISLSHVMEEFIWKRRPTTSEIVYLKGYLYLDIWTIELYFIWEKYWRNDYKQNLNFCFYSKNSTQWEFP